MDKFKSTLKEMPSCLYNKVIGNILIGILLVPLMIIGIILSKDITFGLFMFLLILVDVYSIYNKYTSFLDGCFFESKFEVERILSDNKIKKIGKKMIGNKNQFCKVEASTEIDDEKYYISLRTLPKQIEGIEEGDTISVIYNKNSLYPMGDNEFRLADILSIKRV
ncbi:MAG: hypothetical protein E7272_07770 [Pseudobutyrivibrio ruminis]|uniref:Uncharacterized protein n=1 Tax=Pseudobutyrivibrio ruminis TaxID=46206 RepID=A0A927UCD2_9FIRM|nr:hypothetical protein [Pseudobutyrivibrio ruminis]